MHRRERGIPPVSSYGRYKHATVIAEHRVSGNTPSHRGVSNDRDKDISGMEKGKFSFTTLPNSRTVV